jgi:dienelactone hydrolase
MTRAENHVAEVVTTDGRELYVVTPDGPRSGPGVLFLHWFDEAPNANRAQFVDEAKALATRGVVSVLPQLAFPWHSAPIDTESDLARIEDEIGFLHNAHRLLVDSEDVDSSRIAVVGHDFGAMYGSLLLEPVGARCAVLVAPTSRWSDWFLRFWPIASDRFDYMRALSQFDPIVAIPSAGCPLLFHFGSGDFYIAPMTGAEMFQAALEPKQILSYDTGHAMDLAQIESDRALFLIEHLGLE